MSINAIGSVSLYEYYYTINRENSPSKSRIENKAVPNSAASAKAQEAQKEDETIETYSKRPWADLMYQLDLEFNKDAKDDILSIKNELHKLTNDFDDKELRKEVEDLENFAQTLYMSYINQSSNSSDSSEVLTNELQAISVLNLAGLV